MQTLSADAVICGAGSAGLAAAYYLSQQGLTNIVLVDKNEPLSQTSSKSGENYRTWWPNETMVGFVSRSIDLMDEIVERSGNAIQLDRRGYLYVSEKQTLDSLDVYKSLDVGGMRVHEQVGSSYSPFQEDTNLNGADILLGNEVIKHYFPHLSENITLAIHARRAGSLSAQQLGMYHLEEAKAKGLKHLNAELVDVLQDNEGVSGVKLKTTDGNIIIESRILVNAAGPFVNEIAAMLGENLPIKNVFQQKIAFRDHEQVLDRKMPFTIYIDEQELNWSEEDKALLADEPSYDWFLNNFQGGLHIKPEGGMGSILVKLGWAFNHESEEPQWDKRSLEEFPDLVIRGASRFVPELERYIGKLPKPILHYGGYYTKTEENMPLIGPMKTKGAFVLGALSGFGTMACCGAGELVAQHVLDGELPNYAQALAPSRYDDLELLEHLRATALNGEL